MNKVILSVTLNNKLIKVLKKEAKLDNRSLSNYIEIILLNRNNNSDKSVTS
jgi:hypothetical protein